MKFIEVEKARSLKFNTPVFVRIDNDPTPAVGRMLEMKHTKDGVVRVFELTGFSEDFDGVPVTLTTTKVTHVCIPS